VGPVGLEPTTYGLKVRSSAIELEARREGVPNNRREPDASLRGASAADSCWPRRPKPARERKNQSQAKRARAAQE
jgi:hypothetical protein